MKEYLNTLFALCTNSLLNHVRIISMNYIFLLKTMELTLAFHFKNLHFLVGTLILGKKPYLTLFPFY